MKLKSQWPLILIIIGLAAYAWLKFHPQATGQTLSIPEYGVSLRYGSNLNGLNYAKMPGGSIGFSTTELEKRGGSFCLAASAPLGSLSRSDAGPGKKVGGHYYTFNEPGNSCSNDSAVTDLESSQLKDLKKVVTSTLSEAKP